MLAMASFAFTSVPMLAKAEITHSSTSNMHDRIKLHYTWVGDLRKASNPHELPTKWVLEIYIGDLKGDEWFEEGKQTQSPLDWIDVGYFVSERNPTADDIRKAYDAVEQKKSNEIFILNKKILTSPVELIINGRRNQKSLSKRETEKTPGTITAKDSKGNSFRNPNSGLS